MSNYPKISIIILSYNEEGLIKEILSNIRAIEYHGNTEIVLADGGSTDNTLDIALEMKVDKISVSKKGKSIQMNSAVRDTTGEVLFFVHSDMKLDKLTFNAIRKVINEGYHGGGFSNKFDSDNEKIKRIGQWMNFRLFDKSEQSDKGIFYGDNGIFVRKAVFEKLGGFKVIPIMEDYDFSYRMAQNYKVIKIKSPFIIVSARRHIKAGFYKTRFQWVIIRILYKAGVSPHRLARWYHDIR